MSPPPSTPPDLSSSMSKPTAALGVVGLLKEAISLPLRDRKLVLSILLLLFPCSLVNKLNPMPLKIDLSSLLPFRLLSIEEPSDTTVKITNEFKSLSEVDLAGEVLWWLYATVGISSLSIAFVLKPSSLAELFRTIRRKWKGIFITSFYSSLLSYIYLTILLLLSYTSSGLDKNATLRFVLIRISSVVLTVVGSVMFVLVDLGCHLSVVISSVEQGCYGLGALRRAVELIRGRKLGGFALMGLLILLDQLQEEEIDEAGNGSTMTTKMESRIVVGAFAKASIGLTLMLFGSSIFCVLYLECRKGKGYTRREGFVMT